MKLTLYRHDLKPKYQDINCSRTRFKHFRLSVRVAIVIAKRAIFYEYDERNYNAIYPKRLR